MNASIAHPARPARPARVRPPRADAARREHVATTDADRAFLLLRTLFVAVPIVVGIDKFFDVLAPWGQYLAPWANALIPGTAETAMMAIGVVEIVAGLLVFAVPRIGALVVAAWLAGIVVNLVSTGQYFDIALRDLGLMVGALALALLAWHRHAEAEER
jgi:hypothetical protein